MHNKTLIFLIFSLSFLILVLSDISFAQTPSAGGGGGGGGYAIAGCWDNQNETLCNAAAGCTWRTGGSWGWCEEKGCWNYYTESDCTNSNCTWSNPGSLGYCYRKGCWENANSTSCEQALCNWGSYGYCYRPTCWDYKDTTSCESTLDALTCKWDASFGNCYGSPDKICWNYNNQMNCQNAGCNWQQGTCSEVGCWNYWNDTDCTNDTLHSGMNCFWGSQGSSGYCKKNETDCWSINIKATCQSNQQCTWQGSEYCQQKSCWSYSNQTTCTNTSLHPNINCVWDSSSFYCKQEDCWNYNEENNCTNETLHPNLLCTWSTGGLGYCSRTSCWSLNTSESCLNTNDNLNCRWNSQWNGCEEIGCWNYNNETGCVDTGDSLNCIWKMSGSCNSRGCWEYNDSTSCINDVLHPQLVCNWSEGGGNSSSYCYEKGCWNYNDNTSCLSNADEFTCAWDSTYNYCYEYGCWNYNNETGCVDNNCTWSNPGSSGYCYKPGCWNYYNIEGCSNTSDIYDCRWQEYSYCQQQGCWELNSTNSCNSDSSCEWYSWGSCSQKGCWEYKNLADCQAHQFDQRCAWDSTYNYCYEYGCWNYNTTETCGNTTGCRWNSQWNYCEQKGCSNFYNSTECNNATNSTGMNCTWEVYNYCYRQGCWDYSSANSTYCENNTEHPSVIDCKWKISGWCEQGTGNGTSCLNYYNNETCTNANCTWRQNTWCEERGPWNYNNESSCVASGFNWTTSGGWCSEPTIMECWRYDYNQTACDLLNTTCSWNSPYCYRKGCWEYNETTCPATPQELNCNWTVRESSGWCEQLGCWNFWNNQTACENAPSKLNCGWKELGMCMLPCWNTTLYPDESTCTSNPKCSWQNSSSGGWCTEKGCWNYYDNSTCLDMILHPDLNCTWDTTWSYGFCKETLDCWNYNSNQTKCQESSGCYWELPSGGGSGWCSKKGCWNFWNNNTLCEENGCNYTTQSFCEEKRCWDYPDQTDCENNTLHTNIKCRWDSGLCIDSGCSAFDGNESDCKATGYCWWDANDKTCDEPDDDWKDKFENEKTNPGCWIFDNHQDKCVNVTGCYYNLNLSKCIGLEDSGIQCGNITEPSLCNKLPVLSYCCKWQNNTCQADTKTTKCFENVPAPPEGAAFCEDYSSYTDRATCLKIAADPWYMPCKWDDMGTTDTDDDRCIFRSSEKFGNEEKDFGKITSKKDCEFAGGTWNIEYYCEGNKSVPYGWCEKKKGTEGMSCDATCWACEYRPNNSAWNSESEAKGACIASKLGYCEWITDSSAPNGFGYCKMPENMKYGGGDCSNDCKACEIKKSPREACQNSPASCKWVTDTTGATTIGGWCYPKNEKTCSEDCFRCYEEVSCVNYGGGNKGNCQWDSTTKICKPKNFDKEICFDAIDNDGDSKIDCEDASCFSDTFCGGNTLSNCWQYTTQPICTEHTAENCVWIVDSWTNEQWCGIKGENCFLWDNDQPGCNNQTGICQWFNDPKGGFCDINKTKVENCFKLTTEAACKANVDCKWTINSLTGSAACDFKVSKCEAYSQTQCLNTTYCSWWVDPSNPTSGKCTPKCFSDAYNMPLACNNDPNCRWLSGFCDPADQIGMKSEDCWKYNDNETTCGMTTACEWRSMMGGTSCNINMTMNEVICKVNTNQSTCEAVPDSVCKWNQDPYGGWCDLRVFDCGKFNTDSSCTNMSDNLNCTWKGSSPGHCEPICFSEADANTLESCNQYEGCEWHPGGCEPKMTMQVFQGIDTPPVPLGIDECPESLSEEQDVCGFGLKDEPDVFGFGAGVWSMLNSALCNGQQTRENQMSSTTKTGTGTNTTKFYLYLDTDGSETGGCKLYNDNSMVGYEFFFKYIAEWESGQLKELKTSYRCYDGEWTLTDIKLTSYQSLMCNEIGGSMLVIEKSNLNKFSSLYLPEKDMRVYMATAGKSTTEINPIDTAGPKYYKRGSVDFKFEDCMITGVDADGDGLKSENDPDCFMFQQFGYIKYEDCFETGIDEDNDGLVDCEDTDCKYTPNCLGKGINEAGYEDTTAPRLTWYEVDKFPDAAFIKYDSDEPANGTVLFYNNDSSCGTLDTPILDGALLDSNTWNDYRNWHDGPLDNNDFNPQKLGYGLTNNTSYYFKILICDSNGNCGSSACLNFTTTKSSNRKDCPDCEFTLKFTTNANIKFDFGGTGTFTSMSDFTTACGGSGMMSNYTQASMASVRAEGDNSAIEFGNASLIGVTGSFNITDGTTTSGGYTVGYAGMSSEDFDDVGGKMRPKSCKIEIPKGSDGLCNKVWKCDDNVENCVDVTSESTLLSDTSTHCVWKIPCDFSTYRTNTPTASTPISPGGGSSGGFGGGGSGITVSRSKGNVNITIPSIAKGKTANVNIYKTEDVAFRQINISVINLATGIKIFYKKLLTLPSSIQALNNVYNYIEITTQNITVENIHKVSIKFVVSKFWINENSIDPSDIKLYRWSGSKWTMLTTNKIDENRDEITFTSESPGLSYFAISAYKPEEAPTGAAIICEEEWSCTDWSSCIENAQTRKCTDLNNCGTVGNKPEEVKDCYAEKEVIAPLLLTNLLLPVVIVVIILVVVGILAWKFKIFKFKKDENETDKPAENGMKKPVAIVAIVLALLAVDLGLVYFLRNSYSPAGYAIAENYPTKECEKLVPYEAQETYTETEPYTYTNYEDVPIKYAVEQENAFGCYGKFTPLGACLDLTIINMDGIDGVFSVTGYVDKFDSKTNEFTGREEITEKYEIKNGEKQKFSFVFSIDSTEKWVYGYDVTVPFKTVESQKVEQRDVEKTRTITNYRTELVPC